MWTIMLIHEPVAENVLYTFKSPPLCSEYDTDPGGEQNAEVHVVSVSGHTFVFLGLRAKLNVGIGDIQIQFILVHNLHNLLFYDFVSGSL